MRRIVLGLAGVLSLVAAALLAAVWFDDGVVARRGPAVLVGAEELADTVPGLGWVRTGAVLAVVAALAAAGALRTRTRPAAARAAGVHGLAALATGVAAWRLAAATPAVPRAAVLLAAAALVWALAATTTDRAGPPTPVRDRAALAGAVAVALAAAVAAPLGGPWWVYDRLVDATTATASAPATGGTGPAAPGAVRWSHPVLGSMALGPYVVLRERDADEGPSRLVVLDAATGTERWSYRHADAYVGLAGEPTSGVLVLRVNRDGARELRAFDLASGRPLWHRRDGADVVGLGSWWDTEGTVAPSGVLLLRDPSVPRLRAVDPRTGTERWARTLEEECLNTAEFVRSGDVLVMTSLCERTTVRALRTDTGADAWTARLSEQPVGSRGPSRPPLLAGGMVALWVGGVRGYELVGLDPATGSVRWRRPARPAVLPAVVAAGRVVLTELDRRRRLLAVAVDPATGRTAWTTALPDQPLGTDAEQVAGTDGEHFYLVAGTLPGGPGTTRLTVVGPDGAVLGVGRFDGCRQECRAGQVLPSESTELAAAGGTLVVLPSRHGPEQPAVGLGPGPSFSPSG